MLYFILVCIIILCGFIAAFTPKKELRSRTVLLITILCFPLGLTLILTNIIK